MARIEVEHRVGVTPWPASGHLPVTAFLVGGLVLLLSVNERRTKATV